MSAIPTETGCFIIICDAVGCGSMEVMRARSVLRARMDLALGKPWTCAHPPTWDADYCPKHRPRP